MIHTFVILYDPSLKQMPDRVNFLAWNDERTFGFDAFQIKKLIHVPHKFSVVVHLEDGRCLFLMFPTNADAVWGYQAIGQVYDKRPENIMKRWYQSQ